MYDIMYTQALLSPVPTIDFEVKSTTTGIRLAGDPQAI